MIVESALIVGGLSWVFDKVLEHAVGATGHELIREFVRGSVRELGDPQKRERNHDIARAVRGSQLDAMEKRARRVRHCLRAGLGSGARRGGTAFSRRGRQILPARARPTQR